MNYRLIFWTVSLLAVILVTACAPAAGPSNAPAESLPPSAAPAAAPTATLLPLTEAVPSPTIQAVATSRGPDLEASDPATVNLASGGLQLVEFFRFT